MSTQLFLFKLQRYYSVASLLAVLVTAVLLSWVYREVACTASCSWRNAATWFWRAPP